MTLSARLAAIGRWFRPGPIDTAAGLQAFLDERAAFVAQKTIVAYCQMKTRVHLPELLKDKPFEEAFERSRWESFAIALSDLMIIVDGELRTGLKDDAAETLADRVRAMYRAVLNGYPRPAYRADGWEDAFEAFDRRFAVARLAPPRPVREIASHAAQRIFDLLPIHPSLRKNDAMSVEGGVHFLIAAAMDALSHRMRRDAVLADLLGG